MAEQEALLHTPVGLTHRAGLHSCAHPVKTAGNCISYDVDRDTDSTASEPFNLSESQDPLPKNEGLTDVKMSLYYANNYLNNFFSS